MRTCHRDTDSGIRQQSEQLRPFDNRDAGLRCRLNLEIPRTNRSSHHNQLRRSCPFYVGMPDVDWDAFELKQVRLFRN